MQPTRQSIVLFIYINRFTAKPTVQNCLFSVLSNRYEGAAYGTTFANAGKETTEVVYLGTSSVTDKTIEIKSAKDLINLAQRVKCGDTLEGVTICLMKNINMRGLNIAPIGNDSCPFEGHFNGKGLIIGNLTCDSPNQDYMGLFGYVGYYGIVKNVNVENGFIKWNNYTKIGGYWI